MALVSATIPHLVGGISQQDHTIRHIGTSEDQVNAYGSLVEGLKKRRPTYFIKQYNTGFNENSFFHVMERDEKDAHFLTISKSRLNISTPEGKTILEKDIQSKYLKCRNPKQDLKAITLADYTIILNKTVEVQKEETQEKDKNKSFSEALVFIRQSNYKTLYAIDLNGKQAQFTTTSRGNVESTEMIAKRLESQLAGTFKNVLHVEAIGSVIYIKSLQNKDFAISASDSRTGDKYIYVIKDKVKSLSQLPVLCMNGFKIEVIGHTVTQLDNYFVEFITTNGEKTGQGYWQETKDQNDTDRLDVNTLPLAIKRIRTEKEDRFVIEPLEWDQKKCGNEESNPFPPFVGKTINDIFFFQNRFGILSDDYCSFSQAGNYFNFFHTTVTKALDDAPIFIPANTDQVCYLKSAVAVSENLYIFSKDIQFVLKFHERLSGKTASLNPLNVLQSQAHIQPTCNGQTIFYASQQGNHSVIYEYNIQEKGAAQSAANITSHVPRLLPADLGKVIAMPAYDLVIAKDKKLNKTIYIYQYHWTQNQKAQSAWTKFQFHFPVSDFLIFKNKLYLLQYCGEHLTLTRMDITRERDDFDQTEILVDNKINQDQLIKWQYDTKLDKTFIILPYCVSTTKIDVISTGNKNSAPACFLPVYHDKKEAELYKKTLEKNLGPIHSDQIIQMDGYHEPQPCVLGFSYPFIYTFSPQYLREKSNYSSQTVQSGRLQMKQWQLNFSDTGYFRVNVLPKQRDTRTYEYNGKVIGNVQIGQPQIRDGVFRFPVLAKNNAVTIEVINDSVFPSKFLSVEWQAFYTRKAQKI